MAVVTMWEATKAFGIMLGVAIVLMSVVAMFVRDRH